MAAPRRLSTKELRRILDRGEAVIGRFFSARAGRALVRLVAPDGRVREVDVAD
jgi:hypothetical protein